MMTALELERAIGRALYLPEYYLSATPMTPVGMGAPAELEIMSTTRARCTRIHAALKLDRVAWAALSLVGVQRGEDGDPDMELRDCTCGSTLAVELPLVTK